MVRFAKQSKSLLDANLPVDSVNMRCALVNAFVNFSLRVRPPRSITFLENKSVATEELTNSLSNICHSASVSREVPEAAVLGK